jgi:hypothetical protein
VQKCAETAIKTLGLSESDVEYVVAAFAPVVDRIQRREARDHMRLRITGFRHQDISWFVVTLYDQAAVAFEDVKFDVNSPPFWVHLKTHKDRAIIDECVQQISHMIGVQLDETT